MVMLGGFGGGITNPLPTVFAQDEQLSPGTAAASVSFRSDGVIDATNDSPLGWFRPAQAGVGAGYWIRATLASGTTPSGAALGTWLQLNVNRTWALTRLSLGSVNCSLNISIATDSGGTNIVATGTAGITATVSN